MCHFQNTIQPMNRFFSRKTSSPQLTDYERWEKTQPPVVTFAPAPAPTPAATPNPYFRKCCWMEERGAACPLDALGIPHHIETIFADWFSDKPFEQALFEAVQTLPRNHQIGRHEMRYESPEMQAEAMDFYKAIEAAVIAHKPPGIWEYYEMFAKKKHYYSALLNRFIDELCMQHLRRSLEKPAWRNWLTRHSVTARPANPPM